MLHQLRHPQGRKPEGNRFAPDAKVGNCNGLYVCDRDTNVWAQKHNASIEETLVGMFAELDDSFTPASAPSS